MKSTKLTDYFTFSLFFIFHYLFIPVGYLIIIIIIFFFGDWQRWRLATMQKRRFFQQGFGGCRLNNCNCTLQSPTRKRDVTGKVGRSTGAKIKLKTAYAGRLRQLLLGKQRRLSADTQRGPCILFAPAGTHPGWPSPKWPPQEKYLNFFLDYVYTPTVRPTLQHTYSDVYLANVH